MRVYSYGTREPFENAELVRQQLWLANIYQRTLVLLERDRRDAVEQLYRAACAREWSEYETSSRACEVAAAAVRMTRARPGDMLNSDEEMKAEQRELTRLAKDALAASRKRETEALQAWKVARKQTTPDLRDRMKQIDDDTKARAKFAYNAAGDVGLIWGTRLKVGESVERAAKMSAKEGSMPSLPRFDGSGAVTVQLQGPSGIGDKNGLAPKDAHARCDTRFRIHEVDPAEQWQIEYVDRAVYSMMSGHSAFVANKRCKACVGDGAACESCGGSGRISVALPQPDPNSAKSKRRERGLHRYAVVRLRVGSSGKSPIWAAWLVSMHRPLPENAPIKWVSMCARKIGPRTEWSLNITIDEDAVPLRDGGPVLAVNLGWRNHPDGGLRVAFAVGSDGFKEDVRVPPAYIAGVEHVQSLSSIRKRLFNDALKYLDNWIEGLDTVPAWLADEARYRNNWLAPKRLVWLLSSWKSKRFVGDQRVYEVLAQWRDKDRHLWMWESDERQKLLRMRCEHYRQVAARWATRYARVLVTDMDLRDFAELVPPEDGAASDGKVQRVSQRLAAPSELTGALKNACSTRGVSFERVDGKYKTQTCHVCGIVFAFVFAQKQDLEHTCECGARWDQDDNHSRNLLASDRAPKKPRGSLATSVSGEMVAAGEKKGRWQKRRSQKSTETSDSIKESA